MSNDGTIHDWADAIPRGSVVGVAMSGGVDSSVAASLLVERGFEVVGLTMHLWTDAKGGELSLNRASGCCSITMARDAAQVAERLGFRHYVLNLSDEFHGSVVQNFAREYLSGRTPNPCVRCNTFVKWQTLLERSRKLGCDYLATGHYARVVRGGERSRLFRARHLEKDQSYALWGLSQESLARTLFPLGDLPKREVRRIASEHGLATADKPESQDICFVPDNDYRRFLGDNFAQALAVIAPGEIVGPDGIVLGRHGGVSNFTVGQRKGLGIAHGRPLYVTRIDVDENRVYVDDEEHCFSDSAIVEDVNWISIGEPNQALECEAKVRYRDGGHAARVMPLAGGRARIEFARPVRAVTPGQSAVFYRGDELLGGGVLLEVSRGATRGDAVSAEGGLAHE
ncbi:tRNA 2-thiouridine(34) synthase MnmA [candidate division KSB1 bacterium]|nr:tRNA 2-thiouridine(34) synthase MnmA [candidate division KSB1 bacterium]